MSDTHQPSSDTERQEAELRHQTANDEQIARNAERAGSGRPNSAPERPVAGQPPTQAPVAEHPILSVNDMAAVDRAKEQRDRLGQPTPESVAAKYAGPQSQQPTVVDGGGRVVSVPAAEDAEKKRLAAEPSNLTPDEKAEYEAHGSAPKPVKDVVRTPEETMRANLEAPGHKIGDAIDGNIARSFRADCGLFQCGIDALGRVWRVEDGENGMRLVLAGWLNT